MNKNKCGWMDRERQATEKINKCCEPIGLRGTGQFRK